MEEKIELHWLSNPVRWAEFLGYIRLGYGPHQAANAVGTTKRALDSYVKMDPVKAEQYEDALDFWREQVEGKLHDAAMDGEPWAITMTLKAELRDKYGANEKATTTVVVGSAAELARLIELAAGPSVPHHVSSGLDDPDAKDPEQEDLNHA